MSINMADEAQLKELMQYISENLHYPVLGFGGGADLTVGDIVAKDVAIGTVIPGFLYADGTVYNIADYPQLAAHYASHHGAANFYGGDGVTTFAVPDLRGEFIRGCGTNGHANQGSGAGVGVHQDGTEMPYIYSWSDGSKITISTIVNSSGKSPSSADITDNDGTKWANAVVTETGPTTGTKHYNTRPTNTSYPIYIKATLGHTYSIDEQPVGTWIDGSILYERTIHKDTVSPTYLRLYTFSEDIVLREGFGSFNYVNGQNTLRGMTYLGYLIVTAPITPTLYQYQNSVTFATGVEVTNLDVTVRYTKTTD